MEADTSSDVGRRRLFCPQVIQTSHMDCGPAAVKALLEGFGIETAYGRLREACQTDVDGTAIGALETLIRQLGLDVEQVMVPVDHVLLGEPNLPSIPVVLSASGLTHYVVAWRGHGRRVQIMDPVDGRRFPPAEAFERTLFRHRHEVAAEAWLEWARTEDFTAPLTLRLGRLGAAPQMVDEARQAPDWVPLAALDAATRFVQSLMTQGAVPRAAAADLVTSLAERARLDLAQPERVPSVPERYWSVWPAGTARGEDQATPASSSTLSLRGAVLLRITGRRRAEAQTGPLDAPMLTAIRQGDGSPWRLLLDLARSRGRRLMAAVTLGTAASSLLVALEALLFYGLIQAADRMTGLGQLPFALLAVMIFVAATSVLELAADATSRHLGRHLEIRVRTSFLRKIPLLGDRFFESRPRSDMAERAHSVTALRQLPAHLADLAGSAGGLVATTVALAIFFPDVGWLAVLLAAFSLTLPLVAQPFLEEKATGLRTFAGALAGHYLDALRGTAALRAHRAGAALTWEHRSVLGRWLDTAFSFNRRVVLVDSLQACGGLALAAAMVLGHTGRHGLDGGVLLLTYWALALPGLGDAFAQGALQLPDFRSIAARFAEPINAPVAEGASPHAMVAGTGPRADEEEETPEGVDIRFESVSVVAGGHRILHELEAQIRAGERIAVIGPSGAGKSTLLGLLLGWHHAAGGTVRIDGEALDAGTLAALRERTAWVDPEVTLWNHSLLANLRYGDTDRRATVEAISQAADLKSIIAGLPDGLASVIGEGGGRLAGGEGQRVRFARALNRRGADLVILDEPFRGLEGQHRRALLEQALDWWRGATVLCATHDVGMVELFDRVAVIEHGRLVELAPPEELRNQPTSRLSQWLEAERRRQSLWSSPRWRRLHMQDGRLMPQDPGRV